ncbi:tyrosine-protein phosphatase [Mycobacterium shimoidei]|uniref:tyrosine-protein phosphatase n=1 Tax=Mycobacterium shimoidei TaxID=29313 RepID=UPI000848DC36|nr:tyrosine-protein phosphatase [Mycobacterium shimoidei]MCV7258640.1 tyrosine-protein phosphatase [Mycobacterium shimoidei]ODR15429.1 phosphotyrosine protein phosphatase [Mycobacterium shimoidei]ORW80005.1 phosphotyrosine protein phosphatase [Mycobacterium shimoidei]
MATEIVELSGAVNFRDVGLSVGIRPGRLFRSGELSQLDDDGRRALRELGITDVADLRSRREVERRGPGQVPNGVAIHLLPIPDLATEESESVAPHEHAWQRMLTEKPSDQSVAEAAARFMIDEYQRFPTYNGAQHALRRVVSLLASGRPVLAHCFAGKDRTGFMIATVLEAIGLDRDAVVADYLRSNDAAAALRTRILEMIEQRADTELTPEVMTFTQARLSDEVLGVRAEYLDAARRTIDEKFGSLGGYLRDSGVTADDVDALRAALLG